MFTNFETFDRDIAGVTIHGVTGGSGPPLLLLHGYPQTHVMWHKVAPELAKHFTLVIADLRGYGDSSKPPSDDTHAPYAKRAMALDMVGLMAGFGYDRYAVLAHDRGARVAHRMAVDHPDVIEKMVLLDIAPTREMYAKTTAEFATLYWHWFWLIQPAPFPETQINAHPLFYLQKKLGSWGASGPFAPEAMAAYHTAIQNPETVHAMCEDYRAAATVDMEHDDEGGVIRCPIHVLWGANGVIEKCFDCLGLWRQRAEVVSGRALPGGHYLAEELPDLVAGETLGFLRR
ncbi:MAG: alpha/beta hydrolase [Pseudomonadota bacterium]